MKTLDDFVVLFSDQFIETDPSTITPDTQFHQIDEWSSLMVLSIIAMVDEEFGVALKGDDIKHSITVKDLYHLVIGKL